MGYTVHGILQARILQWVAVPFSRGSSLFQGIFPTQGSNPGLPNFRRSSLALLWGYLPDPGIEPGSSALQVASFPTEL